MIGYLIMFIGGIVVGVILTIKYIPQGELDTKKCVDYLSKEGFYVNLNRKAEV